MSILDTIETPKDRPVMVTICGDAGMGKTSLAATFPRPIFIRAEDGLQAIPSDKRPPAFPEVQGFDHLMQQMTALIKEDHNFQTCVIDSISKLDIIFSNELRKKEGKDNLAQCGGGFGGGFEIIAGQHQTVRRAAAAMNRRGMHVVFLAHADVETMRIPDADDYMRWTLRMGHKKSLPPYVEDVDVVGFLTLEKFVKGEDGRVKRAVSTGDRELICHATAANISKNRYGITDAIPVKIGENPLAKYIPALNKGE